MPKSNALRGKEFRERKKLAANPVERVTKNEKIIQIHQECNYQISIRVYMRKYPHHTTSTKKNTAKYSLNAEFNDKQKIVQIHQVLLPNLHQVHMREYGKKYCQNSVLMPSLRDGDAIETLLMTAKINTDFVNHPVPSTTEPSTSIVRVGTDECESIINYILRYKDYDFHKMAWSP
ncbi:uncharacterized protein TNCV_2086181 [Trichonephila clavipes]|nr:uncharacterized protein TNCV_2086181 [Trichonephila clavipes]